MLTIFKVLKGCYIYKLVYGYDKIKTKESKNSWMCTICKCYSSTDCDMFQVSNESRFHRICSNCLNDSMNEFVDFCFGDGTAKLLKQF